MSKISNKIINIVSVAIIFAINLSAQMPTRAVDNEDAGAVEGDSTLYYVVLFVLVVGLVGAVSWWWNSKKVAKPGTNDGKSKKDVWEAESVDADKEMEWLRRNSRTMGRKESSKKLSPSGMPRTSKVLSRGGGLSSYDNDSLKTQQKTEEMHFDRLPINQFAELKKAKVFEALPISNDAALMSAVEQTQDEYEEDDAVRELAIRILEKFKTRNSVEALAQVGLYDLSAPLRSKAISALAVFDHESVFETILLGCADPTREVRATSAKALFQLSFNRADAWTRIAESDDDYRIIQAARAAIESDLVERSIDRLIHEDNKYAYEAFTLVALLIRAGETKEIFQTLENHRNSKVKLALLKAFVILKDEKVLPEVYSYLERNTLPEDLSFAANEVIKSCNLVPA